MSNLSTHNILKIFLINFLGVLSFSAVLILIFIDIWAFQNGESSDIAARGSFLAGFLLLPTIVIFTLLIGTISYSEKYETDGNCFRNCFKYGTLFCFVHFKNPIFLVLSIQITVTDRAIFRIFIFYHSDCSIFPVDSEV